MSLKKQYLKSKPICKVTFRIPEAQGRMAKKAQVLGNFNDWSVDSAPMKRLKSGAFNLTLDLETGREYEFRYLFDGRIWQNDADADGTVSTPFGDGFNSKIVL